MRKIKFSEAINEATSICLNKDKNFIVFGLGSTDPRRIFGTTNQLVEKYGKDRVFDVPTSENALTGMSIGLASTGIKVLFSHQRVDFSFLSLDQIINNLSKWYFMYGGQKSLPITIRMIIGRGWGQGPTHAQSFQSLFSRIPGLKVVMPSNPANAKGLLISSILDPNPVIFLEHRWLHNLEDKVNKNFFLNKINKSRIIKKGKDITIIGMSYSSIEIKSLEKILKLNKIDAELIDLISISPIDYKTIYKSVLKTKKLLIVDTCHVSGSIGSEIISGLIQKNIKIFCKKPVLLGLPDFPVPTSYGYISRYYPSRKKIFIEICKMLEIKNPKYYKNFFSEKELDKPKIFDGPF
jgi:pyruvate/2-oxoglutarate/acetoin dehydrogenase E1 component